MMNLLMEKKKTKKRKSSNSNISENLFSETKDLPFQKNPRKRRGRNKKNKIYFSKDTENAIVKYNNEECPSKRNDIYNEEIKYGFEKLVENIFNTFKFIYFDSSPIEIQQETVSHLISNIHKYESCKGKAFSYFSIVAKNYLIFHNNNNYKRYNQHICISETPSESEICLQKEDSYYSDVQNQELMDKLINYWDDNLEKIFNKQKDLIIADFRLLHHNNSSPRCYRLGGEPRPAPPRPAALPSILPTINLPFPSLPLSSLSKFLITKINKSLSPL